MIARAPIPFAADPRRPMPEAPGARWDAAETARRVLADEGRRLERLGLTAASGRCLETRRYWSFVQALLALAEAPRGMRLRGDGGQE